MATTTNYGWTTPDDTALVKDGASAIRSLGTAIDTTVFNNAGAAIAKTLIDAKGDLIVGSAADTAAILAVGTNGQYLVADSAATNGVKWATFSGGGKVLQVVSATYATQKNSTSTTYADTDLTATITPSAASSKVLVLVELAGCGKASGNTDPGLTAKLMRDSTDLAVFASSTGYTGTSLENIVGNTGINFLDTPATTSATTYKVQFKNQNAGGTVFVHKDSATSSIVLLEIGA